MIAPIRSSSPSSRATGAPGTTELRLAFLAIADFESLHRPFVTRNRVVLDALVDEGPESAAAELERYLTESERRILGAYARLGRA